MKHTGIFPKKIARLLVLLIGLVTFSFGSKAESIEDSNGALNFVYNDKFLTEEEWGVTYLSWNSNLNKSTIHINKPAEFSAGGVVIQKYSKPDYGSPDTGIFLEIAEGENSFELTNPGYSENVSKIKERSTQALQYKVGSKEDIYSAVFSDQLIGPTLTVTVVPGQSKVYGSADPELTFTVEGFEDGDGMELKTGNLVREAGENAGEYAISLGTLSFGDKYTIEYVGANFTILKKELEIRADILAKVYGEENPTLTFTYTGLANGDTKVAVEPSISTVATQNSNVGAYRISLSGGFDPNYNISLVNGILNIIKKDLTITAEDKLKVYSEANPALTFTYNGLVNGDTKVATEPSIATTATASSNVGTYPITLSGGEDQNYTITLVSGTLTIGKKALTITADDKQKIYGDPNPVLTLSYSGLVNGDLKVSSEPEISTTATLSSPVGTYPITLSGGEDMNYSITLKTGELKINKATLTVQANPQTKFYGALDPELTYIASGFKLSDNLNSLSGKLSREPGELVGKYPIGLGTLVSSDNYRIEFKSATFEIIQAVLAMINNPDRISTPWSIQPVLPSSLKIITEDGQVVELPVVWDSSTLNLFKRGTYALSGTMTLPAGILNPKNQKALLEVVVLPKPAPQDVLLSNNSFDPDPKNYFQFIGGFSVIDPIDRIHIIRLKQGAGDNQYFEVKEGFLFWSSADAVPGKTQFTVVIEVIDRDGNRIEKAFTINRGRTDLMDLEVFNTFTPNGDGKNDTWGVPDIRYFQGARVQVFNREGERIFYTESPDVRWDGTYKGKEIPAGTYFWVIEVKETGKVRRGILTILRN